MTKQCSKCLEVKPIHCFRLDRTRPDGREYWCIKCKSKLQRKINKRPINRLKAAIRSQIKASIDKWKVGTKWILYVEWTIDELVRHLEDQFEGDMCWNNYGRWHLDHVKPKYDFDMPDIHSEGFKDCWALENLQPLWGHKNLIKGKHHFSNMYFGEEENWEEEYDTE